jgi:hypothetical protein
MLRKFLYAQLGSDCTQIRGLDGENARQIFF